MDFIPESYNSQSNDERVAHLMALADEAAADNHKRLAIHLYIAAFEQENIKSMVPSAAVLGGMSHAWDMAFEIGDKSSAEVLFAELSPYSSPDQVQERVRQLQEMAYDQLKEMGVPSDRIERMTPIHSPRATAAGADPDFMDKLRDVMATDPNVRDESDMPQTDADVDEEEEEEDLFSQLRGGVVEDGYEAKKYKDLVGYDSELRQMCVYGFESAGDQEYKRFIRETSEFHGVDGLSLYEPFIFFGPSREDVYEFAEATAGEIGNPVVSLHVRTDDEGMWTMRLSGPFRRGIFGVSDPTDVPMPCTFIIENIDLLQDFIRASARSEAMGYDIAQAHPSNAAPHSYNEILGYVHSMMSKPKVFVIATAAKDIKFLPQLDDLFARAQKINVDYPDYDERRTIWADFAKDHASFSRIDLGELSKVSAGISRHDLVAAGRNAVRDAYQKSITNTDYEFVEIKDVLFELVPFMSEGSESSVVEDAAAMAFVSELEGMLFEPETDAESGSGSDEEPGPGEEPGPASDVSDGTGSGPED